MRIKGKALPKAELPTKICVACARPFTWRKKWNLNWEQIKYCSAACRGRKNRLDIQNNFA